MGTATVNGAGNFRFRAVFTGAGFEIRLWTATGSFEHPTLAASGTLSQGAIRVRPRV